MTELERLNPRFVTGSAAAHGAQLLPGDWPGNPTIGGYWALTGHGFDTATVVCSHADLDHHAFREWLLVVLRTRFDRQVSITLVVL